MSTADHGDQDVDRVPTLRERMRAAGMSEQRITAHHDARAVLLDGREVDDLDLPAPPGSRWHVAGR